MPMNYNHDHDNEITLFGATNFRNQMRRFGIKTDDRRRHMYVIGKTGTGKTTLLENMVMSDVLAGHGVCFIDPHGDTAEKLLDYIPSWRINDIVYFNPADLEYPVGFNILETTREEQKHLVASGLMGVFKKIWPDVWSPRMEYILLNCVLALLDYPGATLLGINRLLVDKEYRQRVIVKIRNPIVKTFWVAEFTSWSEKYATEAIAPVQNKVGQFLSASIIRNIVAQVKSSINPRQIMDEGKILIVNLSKGKIGEDNMRLLGGMMVTKLQLAAMERVDIKNEEDRRDFYLYVDEFQNFANEAFASILSEARKYRLNLTIAHQYIAQLDEAVAKAVFGNVGTLAIMRVGAEDASFMEQEFTPIFTPEDLVSLPKYQMYLKLMVDGVTTQPFSANTLPPIAQRTGSEEKVISVARERYAEPRFIIEEKVLRWSGMEAMGAKDNVSYPTILTEEEMGAEARALTETAESKEEDTEEYLKISEERLSAIVKAPAKKEKPKFPHTCTRCGKKWDMPIQLDPTRPVYCAECLPIIREERKTKKTVMKSAVSGSLRDQKGGSIVVETAELANKEAAKKLKAVMDIDSRDGLSKAEARNKPRIVGERKSLPPLEKGKITVIKEEGGVSLKTSLLAELELAKGKPIETNKKKAVPPLERRGRDFVPRESLTSTVFKPVVSSVRPHGPTTSVIFKKPAPEERERGDGPKPVAPGEKIVFE